LINFVAFPVFIVEMSDSPLSEAPSTVSELDGGVAPPATTITSNSKRKRASVAPSQPSPKRVRKATTNGGLTYKEEDGSEGEVVSNTIKTTQKSQTPKRKSKSKSTTIVKTEVESKEEPEPVLVESAKVAAKKRITTKKTVEKTEVTEEAADTGAIKKKVIRKRKTKEEKEAEAMPIAARTIGSKIVIGAHVSSAGGMFQSFHSRCLWLIKGCS
jgi:AP endonuclease-1